IIFQGRTDIVPNDSAEDIAAKVLKLEHEYYPMVVEGLVMAQL
ncbi:MAG: phosphoribosylglycinamide formyltransferase, partial [Saprospiraceae bacterium]|nr:phosphoribosylglycinamide formyltransferase [Saprospiraceae bacterium]